MGILNITPNSFAEIGRFQSIDAALKHADQMIKEGVDIIDIGGEPTNPSVHSIVSLQEELDRVIPVITAIKKEFDIPLSIDTSKATVMKEAIHNGVNFINDVRALINPQAMQVVAQANIPVCLMHMTFPAGKNNVASMNVGDDIVTHIKDFLRERIAACIAAGIKKENIVIDPGFGAGNFGKDTQQNLQLLSRLDELLDLDCPVLVGLSRKTFIGELLNLPVADRLYGSIAAAVLAASKGAKIIRTHDVKPTIEAIKLVTAVQEKNAKTISHQKQKA